VGNVGRMAGALEGLRVIDLSQMIAGPYCTQLLADLGADVIKVEDPATAPSRRKGRSPPVKALDGSTTTFAAYWLSANRNKRAASIDLKTEEGRRVLRELVASSDVVVENLSGRAQESLGLTYAWAASIKPDIIWASLTAFGRTGPDAGRGGWDLLAQARSGLMSLAGTRDGPPMKSGTSLIDYIGGLHLAVAVLAAVRHRDRTGEGQFVDIALLDCAIACLDGFPTWAKIAGVVPERNGNHNPMKFAGYAVYKARDGYITVGAPPGPLWQKLVAAMGRVDLATVPDYNDAAAQQEFFDRATPVVSEWIGTRDLAELRVILDRHGVPNEAVQDVGQIWSDPQLVAREMFYETDVQPLGKVSLIGSPLKLSATPVAYDRSPPEASEHTLEILADVLGYDDERIAQLVAAGALGR